MSALVALLLVFSSLFASPLLAYTLDDSVNPTVSATVPAQPDLTRPDIPVLISPANNSIIATTAPTFVFNPSLGSTVVSHYQLYLDGNKNTDHIPQSTLTITTNALTSLVAGQHTWFIKAIGTNGAVRDTATWVFTIDTTAPLILVENIGEHTTSLSSLDYSTIYPGLSFTTNKRQPVFTGISEANANLTISLTSPTHSTSFSVIVSSDNTFSLSPNNSLPLGTYTVTVSATDVPGNTTVLPPFELEVIAGPFAAITIPLPSPLPTITIPLPQFPFDLATAIPPLPAALTAYPIATAAANYLPWIIILFLILHSLTLAKGAVKKEYHRLSLYITIFVPILLLIYLTVVTLHWIPFVLALLATGHLVYLTKIIKPL